MTCVSMCGFIHLTIFSKACSCGFEDPNDCSEKVYCNALVDDKGCEGETEGRKGSEGLRETQWRETGSRGGRVREKEGEWERNLRRQM